MVSSSTSTVTSTSDPTEDGGAQSASPQSMTLIAQPHHNDVLCGRGVATNNFPGNQKFRSLVGTNRELYVTSTKRQKMSISRSIVDAVRSLDPPGRFLEKDGETGLWADVGDKKAIEKTSQALRDGASGLRSQLSNDLSDPNFISAVFDSSDENNTTNKSFKSRKPKITKVKTVAKGHRRTNSNPEALSAAHKKALIKNLNVSQTGGQNSDISSSQGPLSGGLEAFPVTPIVDRSLRRCTNSFGENAYSHSPSSHSPSSSHHTYDPRWSHPFDPAKRARENLWYSPGMLRRTGLSPRHFARVQLPPGHVASPCFAPPHSAPIPLGWYQRSPSMHRSPRSLPVSPMSASWSGNPNHRMGRPGWPSSSVVPHQTWDLAVPNLHRSSTTPQLPPLHVNARTRQDLQMEFAPPPSVLVRRGTPLRGDSTTSASNPRPRKYVIQPTIIRSSDDEKVEQSSSSSYAKSSNVMGKISPTVVIDASLHQHSPEEKGETDFDSNDEDAMTAEVTGDSPMRDSNNPDSGEEEEERVHFDAEDDYRHSQGDDDEPLPFYDPDDEIIGNWSDLMTDDLLQLPIAPVGHLDDYDVVAD